MFDSSGDSGPPCGVPSVLAVTMPSCIIPASRNRRISFNTRTSRTPPLSASCSSRQRFASGFLQTSSHPDRPCRAANGSPCRVRRGLSPLKKCAPCRAHKEEGRLTPAFLLSASAGCSQPDITSRTSCRPARRSCAVRQTASVSTGCLPPARRLGTARRSDCCRRDERTSRRRRGR
jgi:hypothetical protein